ncbi:substrate-binding domain-containing protein [Actinoplanes sp. NPDC051851]|uniref:LacI family DNA-binding transcriptional regulator n=1 Tax=Actinoplanes sp. NPDC051851 TaxID=3154753 RepID=UPI003432F3FC
MTRQRRATLDEVAAHAGVSKATASKVLNHRPGISASTRRRVEEAMRELDYSLTTTPPVPGRTVTAVFDTLVNLYSLKVLEGAIDAADSAGVDLVTSALAPNPSGRPAKPFDPAYVHRIAAKGHTGLLVVTTRIGDAVVAACASAGLPLVAVDPPNALDGSVVSIGSHHWVGGMQAAQHLLSLGHRRIAFVGGEPDNAGLRERFGGYREVLETAGVTVDPRLVSQEGMGSSERAVGPMLALPPGARPTAVFAATDGDALSVIRVAYQLGLSVPRDVSVVGYDDTYAAIAASTHLLTTVRTPMHGIGDLALKTLLQMSAGIDPVSRQIRLSTTLITRETTAPPPP